MANQNNNTPTTNNEDCVKMRKERIIKVSSTVSSVLRQFILAGIGIVWLFRVTNTDGAISLDANLLFALSCFVCAILAEFLHYLLEILANAIYLCGSRRTKNMSTIWAFVPWFLWGIKLGLVLLAYVRIGSFLFGK